MTFQERKSILEMATSIIVLGVYSLVFYLNYENWGFDSENIFRFYAIFFVLLIGVSIFSRIIAMIVFAIINTIINEVKGEEPDELDMIDERDKLIELKASRNSMFIFIAGVLIAFVSQLFNTSEHVFFILLFTFGLLSDVGSSTLKLYYYKKGV